MVEGISFLVHKEYGLELYGWVVRTPKYRRFLWELEKAAPCALRGGGSSILISESGLPVSSELILSVSTSLKQGLLLSHRSIEWGFGWLQTDYELGEIVEYLTTVAILLGMPFRGNSKIPGKSGLPTDVP